MTAYDYKKTDCSPNFDFADYTEYTEEERKETYESSGSSTATTTTTTTTATNESSNSTSYLVTSSRESDEMDMIKELYRDVFHTPIPRMTLGEIRRNHLPDALGGNNVDLDYYIYAIAETARAPKPSWAYTAAIIRRLMGGISAEERKRIKETAMNATFAFMCE